MLLLPKSFQLEASTMGCCCQLFRNHFSLQQRWLLHAAAPLMWGQGFDKAAAVLRHGEVQFSLAIFLAGLAWYLLVIPINFGGLEFFASRLDKLVGSGWWSSALFLSFTSCIYLCSHLVYFTCFEVLPTPLLAVLVYSAVAFVIFVAVWRWKK